MSLRLLLPLALVVVPAAASAGALLYARALGFSQGLETARHDLKDVVADAQLTIGRALADKKMEHAHESVAELAMHPGVRWAVLLDPDNNVVASTRVAWRDQPASRTLPPIAADTVMRLGPLVRHTEVPAVDEVPGTQGLIGVMALRGSNTQALIPGPLWLVVIDYDYATEVQSHLRSATVVAAAVGMSAVTFGLLLAVYLQRRLSSRLRSILHAAAAVAAGDLSIRSGVFGRDELGQIGAGFDAMAARLAEDAAARATAEKKFRDAFQHDGDALLLMSRERTVVEANIAAERLFGRSADALRGARAESLGVKDAVVDVLGSGREGTQTTLEVGDGPIDVELRIYALTDGAQLLRLRDLRPERELDGLRERLRTADRLAALGALSASVGHEINNPLSFVIGNLQALRDAIDQHGASVALRDEAGEIIADIGEGAERIRRIVQDLRLFSRQQDDGALAPFDPSGAVRSALALATPAVRGSAVVVESLGSVPRVSGDPRKLGQVLINLVVNAGQAIASQDRRDGRIDVRLRHDVAAPRAVILEVEDDGPGVPDEAHARIFEPFFTTKGAGQGTGLGLTISREIVTKMGGALELERKPGRGTIFRISLPVAADAAEEAHTTA